MANKTVRSLWQLWHSALSPEQVDLIIAAGEAQPAVGATVFADSQVDTEIRSSTIRWLKDRSIRDLLWEFVKEANINAFGVDVENYAEMQFTEYYASQNGHYDWHHDVNWQGNANSDRKLSVTVQLSHPNEYEGGAFEFNECQTPLNARARGTVLVFPSYLHHRVLPVTSGSRKSLVAWFHGPRWR